MERWSDLFEQPRWKSLSEQPIEQSRKDVELFLTEIAESLSPEVIDFLDGDQDARHFQASAAMVDQLDALCFTLEDAGHRTESERAFSAARFASAWVFLNKAASVDDLMNAVYEAHHANLADAK